MFQSYYFYRRCLHGVRIACIPVLSLCLAMLVMSGRLNAQVQTGINGTVVDSSGAAIPGARVTVKDASTGVVTQGTTTSSVGTFVVIGLNPGHYSVTVDATGFKTSMQTNVTVEISKVSAVAFNMVPGSVSQIVLVTSSQISLNTTSPEMTTTLEPELVRTLPIEVSGGPRMIDAFVGQAPGVTNATAEFGFILSGGESMMDSAYINGIPLLGALSGQPTEVPPSYPPYEMIKEFSVNVSTFSAQYGLSQGTVTYNTASGTNHIHGDAFDIMRNSFFDSDGFFPQHFNADGHPAPPTNHQNDYGFTVGGPVSIPKLYDGRNRTFFLFTLDNYRENAYTGGFGTVPTTAMKGGDFSHFLNAQGNQIPIYDPQTGKQFPGNIIPLSRFSPFSQALLKYVPDPNRAGTDYGQQNNEKNAIPSVANAISLWGFTLDHNFNERQSIHYGEWRHSANSPGGGDVFAESNPLQSVVNNYTLGDSFLLNYVNTLTPNLVLTAGMALYTKTGGSQDAQRYPLGNTWGAIVNPSYFPGIVFADGEYPPTAWGQSNTENIARVDALAVDNNWLWSKGRNTFNIGGEYRFNLRDVIDCTGCGGEFDFSQKTTSIPNPEDPNFSLDGSSFASFLLGEVDAASRTNSLEMKIRSTAVSSYIEDNIKVNGRLTLDAGLRWDVLVPFHDTNNNVVYFDSTKPNPGAGGLLGAASKYGNCSSCAGTTRADIHWRDFGPRLGFSYMVNSKTVIQSGFYLAYLDGGAYNFGNGRAGNGEYTQPLGGQFVRQETGTNIPGYGSWDTTPLIDPPTTPFSSSMLNGGQAALLYNSKAGTAPYSQQWNLSLQRQLPWNQFLTLAYVGNRQIHLTSRLNMINQLQTKYLAYGPLLGAPVNSPEAVKAGIKIPYPNFVTDFGRGATVNQALLPYPQIEVAGLVNFFDQTGTALYNAFEAQAEKRFSNGLSYLVAWTQSENLTNADKGDTSKDYYPVNTYDQKLEWAPSLFNVPYMLNIDLTYVLPIGRGQRFWHSKGVWANVFGGWQVAAMLNYSGGSPVRVQQDNEVVSINRPDAVPGAKRATFDYRRSIDYFSGKTTVQPVQFTTNAYTPSAYFSIGNAKRNYISMHGQPGENENFDAMKSFHVTDRVLLTVRCDYFNAFNRTMLAAPNGDISQSTFGMVTNLGAGNRQGQATFRVEF